MVQVVEAVVVELFLQLQVVVAEAVVVSVLWLENSQLLMPSMTMQQMLSYTFS